jgi:hypothetical protein
MLTVNTLLVSKGLSLLSLVPLDDQTVTERKCCSSIRGAIRALVPSILCWKRPRTYNSSQLNNDLAKVVSMCFTASASNSSLVLNSFADYRHDIVSTSAQMTNFIPEPPDDLRISSTCKPQKRQQSHHAKNNPNNINGRHSRSSLPLRHTSLNSLNLPRPKARRSPLVFRPSHARRAHGRLEVIDGRGNAGSALPRRRSCVRCFRHGVLAGRKRCRRRKGVVFREKKEIEERAGEIGGFGA